MINQEDLRKIKIMYSNYNRIHNELSNLTNEVQLLLNKQTILSQELSDTRKREKELINKIESEIKREITQEELIKIINSNE